METKCFYCGLKADGAMLAMDTQMAHALCVIRKLNELLDPDYDGIGEPKEIVGIFTGREEEKAKVRAIYKDAGDLKELEDRIREYIWG